MIDANQAKALILAGTAPAGLRVAGELILEGIEAPIAFPPDFQAEVIEVTGCPNFVGFPPDLRAQHVTVRFCPNFVGFPPGFQAHIMAVNGCAAFVGFAPGGQADEVWVENCPRFAGFPPDFQAEDYWVGGCPLFAGFPPGCRAHTVWVENCPLFAAFPPDFQADHYWMENCPLFAAFPPGLRAQRVTVRFCPLFAGFPPDFQAGAIQITACPNFAGFPPDGQADEVRVTGCPNFNFRSLPRGGEFFWNEVRVEDAVLSGLAQPATLTAQAILHERNVEIRRVMLERMGYARFIRESQAATLDQDSDAGGVRRLLKIAFPNDEDLVVVTYHCPSTGRQYVTRVPPTTRTCHQALAWIAGFDDPHHYKLVAES